MLAFLLPRDNFVDCVFINILMRIYVAKLIPTHLDGQSFIIICLSDYYALWQFVVVLVMFCRQRTPQ